MIQTTVSIALLFFNVGVELGQIAFVTALIGLVAVLHRLSNSTLSKITHPDNRFAPHFARPVAYVVGGFAAYWTIERIAGFVA